MRTALMQLAEDFLSTIVFLAAYFLTGNLYLAIAVSMAVGIGQFVLLKLRGRRPDAMHWLSFTLIILLGGAALITHDSRFVMAKPSIIHFAIGAAMLRRGWQIRYLPPIVIDNVSSKVLIATGYAWAALMFALGLVNLYIANSYSIEVWAWFISTVALGAKIAAFLAQYFLMRTLVRRRLAAAAVAS